MTVKGLVLGLGAAAILGWAAGCGGGGGGGSDPSVGAHPLYVVDMDLDGLDGVPLNTPLTLEFSEFVLPETIRHDTIQVRLGPRYGIQAFGDFKVSGNIVTFYPQIPAKADLSDAGFRPQSQYRITVAGNPSVDQVQAYTGRPLIRTFVGNFATAATTSPDLFTTDTYRDQPPPRVLFTNPPDTLPMAPWTAPGGAVDVPTDSEIQLVFNRVPLAPATITPGNVSLTMIERLGISQSRAIQGTPVVDQSFEGTTLRFVPAFPLADQARFVLRVENRVTDLTGAFDVSDNTNRTLLRSQAESGLDPALAAFALAHPEEVDPRTFLIFTTRDEPTKDLALFLNFDGTDLDQNGTGGLDKNLSNADFNGGVPGAVAGFFTAPGGNGSLGDLKPTASTTLSTNSPNAVNGTFNYLTIDVPSAVTVSVTGTLPGALLSLKGTTIKGVLGASGSKGADAEQAYNTSALPASAGGAGGPGGGKGGDNYQGTQYNGFYAPTAPDAPNGGGRGGGGGYTPTSTAYNFGGGGGGGSHQYPGSAGSPGSYPSYSSWNGAGGAGATPGGIQPTSTATGDGKTFYQKGVGGGGGGPGGHSTYYQSQNWRNAAAAGGGGGGALLLKSAGDIAVSGQVVAKGGPGGNVGNPGYYYYGAAGGGGGGGAIAIYANGKLDVAGGRFDTGGGSGGLPYTSGWGGAGGAGGGGFVQLEDQDGVITGTSTATMIPDFYTGKFDPTGTAADAPSVYVSTWFNMGVFDPFLQNFTNLDFVDENFPGCTIKYEMQMAIEDSSNFSHANTGTINIATQASSDFAKASNFVVFKDPVLGLQPVASTLNGYHYQFYRLRITFTLKDGQKRTDPVPFVDRLRVRVQY